MTEEFAFDLFNLLFEEIRKFSLEGVGSCLTGEFGNQRYSVDSTEALDQLYREVQNSEQRKSSLFKLVSSIEYYFNTAKNLTVNYNSEVEKLNFKAPPKFQMDASDNSTIEIESVLNRKELHTFLKMLGAISRNIESDLPDNVLLEELNVIYYAS